MRDDLTPEQLTERSAELARIEAEGGHLHTWPGGLSLADTCPTCGALIDQYGRTVDELSAT